MSNLDQFRSDFVKSLEQTAFGDIQEGVMSELDIISQDVIENIRDENIDFETIDDEAIKEKILQLAPELSEDVELVDYLVNTIRMKLDINDIELEEGDSDLRVGAAAGLMQKVPQGKVAEIIKNLGDEEYTQFVNGLKGQAFNVIFGHVDDPSPEEQPADDESLSDILGDEGDDAPAGDEPTPPPEDEDEELASLL